MSTGRLQLSGALGRVSMVCANYGNGAAFGDVLHDWFGFLGGRPGEVVVVDGGSDDQTQRVCWELFRAGDIDRLELISPKHPNNHKDLCYIQEHAAGAGATKEYLLWFKIDTLPYRRGFEEWLPEALELLERPDTFAIGGSFNTPSRTHEAWPGWYFSDRCSENFALMKRESFVAAMQEYAGSYIASGFRGVNPGVATGQERWLVEVAFERYIAGHRKYTLVREETEDWTVFHTNCQGKRLVKVREKYLERRGVARYMNAGSGARPPDGVFPPGVYYGLPGPALSRRVREAFGASFAGPYWRGIKAAMRGGRKA